MAANLPVYGYRLVGHSVKEDLVITARHFIAQSLQFTDARLRVGDVVRLVHNRDKVEGVVDKEGRSIPRQCSSTER
jgi:hypothetical protein